MTSSHPRTKRLVWAAAVLVVIGTETPLSAQQPQVSLETVDDKSQTGRLIRLAQNEAVVEIETGDVVRVPVEDLVSMRLRPDVSSPPRAWLLLANGDRVDSALDRMTDEALLLEWAVHPDRIELAPPLETVAAKVVGQPADRGIMRPLLREMTDSQFDEDTLLLLDGSRLSGELTSATREAFNLLTSVGPAAVDFERVQALALNSSLTSFPVPDESTAIVQFTDGSWITFQDFTIDEHFAASGEAQYGQRLACPAATISRVDFYGPRVTALSDISPDRVSLTPYLSRRHEPVADRNVRGGFLRLRGRDYPRGLGMTSGTTANYALNGEYSFFQTTVGVDDDAAGLGSVVFSIEVDGDPVYESPPLTGRLPAVETPRIPLVGAQQLTLRVEFAEFGNIQDVADWCRPILVK